MATATENLPWYDLAKQGRVFTGNIGVAGVVLPIYSNNTQQCGLWNPYGSGVDLIIRRIALTYVSTTAAATGIVIGQLLNAPAAIGTGLSITAFTETAAVSDYPNAGYASIAKFGTGATLTVVGSSITIKRHLGLNQLVTTAADATTVPWKADFNFEGDFVVTPGSAIFLAGNIAQLTTWAGGITWAEVPR